MKIVTPLAAIAACAALAACGPKSETTAPAAGSSAAPAASASATGCNAYKAGEQGVIRTFCDGPGVVKVSIDGAEHTVAGAECAKQMGALALNAGVVAGTDAPSPRPDYVGLTIMDSTGGPFKNATLSVTVGGKTYLLAPNSGEFGDKGGKFEGTVMDPATMYGPKPAGAAAAAQKVTGTFTCG